MKWSSFACADPLHSGERFITGQKSFEERLEWREMGTLSDRKFVRVIAPLCRECRDHRIAAAKGGRITQQGALFVEDQRA